MSATGGAVSIKRARIESIDVLRGAVMVLMALDHVRDFFGPPGVSPIDLSRATAALFLTRWITHFCAPVFFLLAGTGAYLTLRRKSRRELSWFLFTRGLWLIFLDVVVLRCLGLQFNFDYHVTLLLVLWALGWAMLVLAALVLLPDGVTVGFGVAMIAGHNLLDSVQSTNPLWSILHAPNFVLNTPQHVVFVAYPLIPWVGVMAAGFGLGRIYSWPAARRKTFLLRLGVGLSAAFLVLRGINRYGDPRPWAAQKSMAFTVLSFLNTSKYPPSLLFLLMTLGPAMFCLWALEDKTPALLRPVLTIGKVPLFYYVLHIPLIHALAVVVCHFRFGAVGGMFESPNLNHFPFTAPPGWGFSLPISYLIWGCVVLALYPLCQWFAGVKQQRRSPWLSYL
jgi:uncharacterized membrane protein